MIHTVTPAVPSISPTHQDACPMPKATSEALASIFSLGNPGEIQDNPEDPGRFRANAHIHLPPNFSAFDSVSHAVELAAGEGLSALGVSNYYNFTVYADFVAEASRRGILPLFGIETIALDRKMQESATKANDPGNPGKVYICGKGMTAFDKMTPRARTLLDGIRRRDGERMAAMTARLEEIFAAAGHPTGLTAAGIIDRIVARHGSPRETVTLQERHLCQAFQERLFEIVGGDGRAAALGEIFGAPPRSSMADPVAVQNEIRSNLMKAGKPAYVAETFGPLDDARELILELGGIPCYPVLADGAAPICGFEETPEALVENLRRLAFPMVEFIPIRNSPEVLLRYVRALRSAGFVVSAGTEHNTLDLIPLEPRCAGGAPIPEEAREIFREGACVIAAHQFLTLHGECGFVDAAGRPNDNHPDAESRIDVFRRMGATLIARHGRGRTDSQ